jgi:prepilin-type processing-associated H-X9-DG protein
MKTPGRDRSPTRSRAFTRLELAALLAAAAVMALVVFPAFAKSREPGRQAHCQSNLRRIGLALLMFSQENDGLFPERSFSPQDRWPQRLLPYYKDLGVLVCPSDGPNPRTYGGNPTNSPADAAPRSYIFNGWNDYFYTLYGWSPRQLFGRAMPEDAIPQPSQTITFGEKLTEFMHFFHDNLQENAGNDFTDLEEGRHGRSAPRARDGGSHYAFADGSVRFLGYGRSLSPVNLWAIVDEIRTNTVVGP